MNIHLLLLPFWTPLIPPMGISCLKSYLKKEGFEVKTRDFSMDEDLREFYNKYFSTLKDFIPARKRGNYYSIGHDVLQNQLMAHINIADDEDYREAVKELVRKTFYTELDDGAARQLTEIIREFYAGLESILLQFLEQNKPELLGLSVYSGNLPASLFAFRLVKKKYPHITTVMGGGIFADQLAPGSPNLEAFLEKEKSIDKIVIGEGEILFTKFLRGELPADKRVITLEDIDRKVLDLSVVSVPDFSDFDVRNYPNMSAYTSRSCPFQCSFCSETIQWGRYRKKSAQQIVGELKELYQLYSNQLFLLSDSLLNPVINGLAEEFIKHDEAIYWDGCLRADSPVDDTEKTFLWRQGGFYRARLGIESGSERILDLMGKKISPDQNAAALAGLAAAGIKTTTLWVIGHPGETEEDFQQTLDFLEQMKDDIYEAECRPFYYYLTGQVGSAEWEKDRQAYPLYSDKLANKLLLGTWVLDGIPSREESYGRVARFVEHCEKLGIPNPYFLHEIQAADKRWKELHKNAVPSLIELQDKNHYIDECKYIKKLSLAADNQPEEIDFSF